MLNKLNKRLLQVSIVVLATSLMIIMMRPVDAQSEPQNSIISSSVSTSNESTRSITQSNGTVVILPASYSNEKTYPALIVLPYTGGKPIDYFWGSFVNQYETRTENSFILILLDVEGSEKDYPPLGDFSRTIERYEKLVINNLDDLIPRYKIDKSRIVLGGSSLGGDLSWALSLRNPTSFRGTIVINSQSTYRGKSDSDKSKIFQQLVANKSRFFMIASEADEYQRLPEMRRAVEELAQYGVAHRFEIIPGERYSSGNIRTEMLMRSVDYVLSFPDFSPRLSERDSKPDGV